MVFDLRVAVGAVGVGDGLPVGGGVGVDGTGGAVDVTQGAVAAVGVQPVVAEASPRPQRHRFGNLGAHRPLAGEAG